ncbi:hypothetical protein ElyMa_002504700 [Elysia marginata]|uniref:DNA helicase Pif1-like 2B domain-containing protein n=1 Tax=Elysia marginata TaxID=1093978 RepID=A0AAV4GRY5_9GAST|nr:hypothetical protein ElyMa_002504700 [Elysia marginata]
MNHSNCKVSLPCSSLIQNFQLPHDPLVLWQELKQDLAEDYIRQHRDLTTEDAANVALINIEDAVTSVKGWEAYNAINTAAQEEQTVICPAEFLNSIEISGLSRHTLTIKVGTPVMLLRSLHPPKLMNGTRSLVVNCGRNVVEVEVAVDPSAG